MSLSLSLPAAGGKPTRYTMRATPIAAHAGPHTYNRA